MNQTLTLLGTLGRTLVIRDANPYTLDVDDSNDTPQVVFLHHDTGGRPFAIFTVAPYGDPGDPRATLPWSRCIIFDLEHPAYRRLCEARPGELVAVIGHWGTYTSYLEEVDERFTSDQLVVEDLGHLGPGAAAEGTAGERILLDLREKAAA